MMMIAMAMTQKIHFVELLISFTGTLFFLLALLAERDRRKTAIAAKMPKPKTE